MVVIFLRFYLFTFKQRRRQGGREEERKRYLSVGLSLVHPSPGTWPATQACALTGKGPATVWFAGRRSVTPARVENVILGDYLLG